MEGKKLVAKIKSMVVSRGMSMREFYQKSGITGGAMSQWKSGGTQPAMSTLQRIAEVLETTVSELVGTDDETKNSATENGGGKNGPVDVTAFLQVFGSLPSEDQKDLFRIAELRGSIGPAASQGIATLRALLESQQPPSQD